MKLKERLAGGLRYAKRGARNGFFHIFAGSTLAKCASLYVLLLPRILGKANYGTLGYADNLINYLILINGLGISNALLRYCSVFDDPREKKSYFSFAVRFGLKIDLCIITAAGAVFCAFSFFNIHTPFYNVEYGSGGLLLALSLTPVFSFLFDCATYYLRANRENRSYSKLSVVFSASYALLQTAFAVFFSLRGIVAGRYLAYSVTLLIAYLILRSMPSFREKAFHLRRSDKIGMFKYSLNTLLANAFSQVMPYNEGLIVSAMVSKMDFADFKSAQVAPQSLQFIALSVIVFIFPYFARNYKDGVWIRNNARKTFIGLSALMLAVTALGIALSPAIVKLYGSKFETGHAVMLMQIFFITFGINGALRMPVGNILAAIGEIRFNIANAIFSSTVHVGICYLFVRAFGIDGAAYGLLCGYVISSVAGVIYLRYYCRKLIRRRPLPPDEELMEDEAS